ncbi:MAG: hypothetical protein QHH80_06910 [Anaerolineae bacterium]|nr:hypothetical protein [Anaerolineae bacterium]
MTRSSPGTSADRREGYKRILMSRWAHWGFLALVMLFFMRGWLNGRMPASPRMEMVVQFATSWFVLDELRHGRSLTPWNPWEFGGFPWMRLLAWPLYASVALIGWLGIPMEQALKALAFVGFAASGVATYEYMRLLTGRWQAALMAGLVYMIAPYHIHTAVDWWEFVPFWALLPLPFLFYEWALRRPDRRARLLALSALCLGLFPWVSPERALVSAVWFAAYAALRELAQVVRRETAFGAAVARLAVVGIGAAVVAVGMVLPAAMELKYLGAYHMRASTGGAATALLADYSAAPALLWGALIRRVGISVDTSTLPTIWKSFGGLFAWYLGWPVLGLATLGLAQLRRQREGWVVAVLGALALWMAFGPTVPVNPFQALPLFKTLIPFRGLMLVVFALAVLAGLGVMTLERIVRRVPLNVWLALAAVVIVVDFRPAGGVFGAQESYFTRDERAAYAFLTAQSGHWRLWEPASQNPVRYAASYSLPLAPVPRFAGHWVEGAPIHTWELLDWGDLNTALDALSVRYAMLRKADPQYGNLRAAAEAAGFVRIAWTSETVEVLEKPGHRPFALLRSTAASEDPVGGEVTYLRESPTRIRLKAAPVSQALLVVSEGWYPHWRAFVDGVPAAVERVDGMLLGVRLEPGTHEVLLVYEEPAVFGAVRLVSAAAALALAAVAVRNPEFQARRGARGRSA